MKRMICTALMAMGLSQAGFAHEGHDKTPGAKTAPHGGVIKGTDQLYLELVSEGDHIKIYPLTHDSAPIAVKQVALQGTASFPKSKKSNAVKFSASEDHFSAKVDAKGSYRYTLEVVLTYQGKREKVKFQVEPQN